MKNVQIDGQTHVVRFWDTAGQELFRALTNSYFRRSDAAIVCYDITSKRTFAKVDYWVHEVRDHCRDSIPILMLGTKADMAEKREVKPEDALSFAKAKELYFMESSAKTNEGAFQIHALRLLHLQTLLEFPQVWLTGAYRQACVDSNLVWP